MGDLGLGDLRVMGLALELVGGAAGDREEYIWEWERGSNGVEEGFVVSCVGLGGKEAKEEAGEENDR